MPSTADDVFGTVSLHNQSSTWPIVALSYIYLQKDQAAKGENICLPKAFVKYTISDEGQQVLVAPRGGGARLLGHGPPLGPPSASWGAGVAKRLNVTSTMHWSSKRPRRL